MSENHAQTSTKCLGSSGLLPTQRFSDWTDPSYWSGAQAATMTSLVVIELNVDIFSHSQDIIVFIYFELGFNRRCPAVTI